MPLHRHDRHCVHSRLDRHPGIGPRPPGLELVPFLPFLPASTVSSAEAPPEDGALDGLRVCCTPQPVVGFAMFPAPVRSLDRLDCGSFPRGLCEAFLDGEYPSKRSPPRQPTTASPHPPPREGDSVHRVAFPLAVELRRVHPVSPRNRSSRSRPQGLSPPESPLRCRSVSAAHRPMLPWALDRTRPDACRAVALDG